MEGTEWHWVIMDESWLCSSCHSRGEGERGTGEGDERNLQRGWEWSDSDDVSGGSLDPASEGTATVFTGDSGIGL